MPKKSLSRPGLSCVQRLLCSTMAAACGVCFGNTPSEAPLSVADTTLALQRLAQVSAYVDEAELEQHVACAERVLGNRWAAKPEQNWLPQEEAALRAAIETCTAQLNRKAAPGYEQLNPLRTAQAAALELANRVKQLYAVRKAAKACSTAGLLQPSPSFMQCVRDHAAAQALDTAVAGSLPGYGGSLRTTRQTPAHGKQP